ncbi:MAG: hypothetical protein EA405_07550 [Rhodospirillales bacterium]|nr:MAG: hypothetical protein EA405_07550 [Rhodospirillales bacterium]
MRTSVNGRAVADIESADLPQIDALGRRCGGTPECGHSGHQCSLQDLVALSAVSRALLATLSERERQVLNGLLDDKPNKVIAQDLGISPRTVEIFRARVMRKTGARGIAELTRMSIAATVAGAPLPCSAEA